MNSIISLSHGFYNSLLTSPGQEVQLAARLEAQDLPSNLGSNIAMIKGMTGDSAWQMTKQLCKNMKPIKSQQAKNPYGDECKVLHFRRLLIAWLHAYFDGNEDKVERLTLLINSLAIN